MITDLGESFSGPAARARRTSARVRPASPRAPTLKKSRRESPSQRRWDVPSRVSISWTPRKAGEVQAGGIAPGGGGFTILFYTTPPWILPQAWWAESGEKPRSAAGKGGGRMA